MGVVVPTEENGACEDDLKDWPALHTLFQHGLCEHRSVGQISANMQSVQRKSLWKDLSHRAWHSFSSQTADQAPAPSQLGVWCLWEGVYPRTTHCGRVQYSIQNLAHLTPGTLGTQHRDVLKPGE